MENGNKQRSIYPESYDSKYPQEIWSASKTGKQGKKSTLGVSARFFWSGPLPEKPLKLFNCFSVYEISILDGEAAVANIKPGSDEFQHMIDATNALKYWVYRKQFFGIWGINTDPSPGENPVPQTAQPLVPNGRGKAFSEKFKMGRNLKGFTPGGYLLQHPDQKEVIVSQMNFLQKNLQQYPANQSLIDACKDALSLFDAGRLADAEGNTVQVSSGDSSPASPDVLIIFEGRWKDKKGKKDVQKVNGREYHLCYRMDVSYDPSRDYPVQVEIRNEFFWVEIRPDKSQNIHTSDALENTLVKKSYNLSFDQWASMVEEMYEAKLDFRHMVYKYFYGLAGRVLAKHIRQGS